MALHKDMSLSQIKSFLESEVKDQIFLEIAPILHIGKAAGGYFGVTRQILCFFDFLGAVYCGYDGTSTYKNGAKKIALPQKTLKFIEEVLVKIDPKYAENGKYLYAMYRHGLVHLYQPRTVKLGDGNVLNWAAYKGGRESKIPFQSDGGSIELNVRHLEIAEADGSKFLPVSINCLYADLLTAIDKYWELLEGSGGADLLKNWISTANAVSEPEESSVVEE